MPTMTTINEAAIKALPTPERDTLHFVSTEAKVQGATVPRGFAVRVTKAGAKAFVLSYWSASRERRITIGRWPDWSCLNAVREARELRQRIDKGEDPLSAREAARAPVAAPTVTTVADVVDRFLDQFVDRKMRRPENYRDPLTRLVVPALGSVPIHDLKRAQIADLMDKVADENGPVMADRMLTALVSGMNWYADRDDTFVPPRTKKLKRQPSRYSRERVLSDDEIRAVWDAAGNCGTFGQMVRFLLLTGQRRGDVAGMRWSELVERDLWEIPSSRYKTGRSQVVPLSQAALQIVETMPRVSELVFPAPTDPKKEISDGGSPKATLDRHLAGQVQNFVIHDLRRTARSLMSRAGVQEDIAERVVGHTIGSAVGRVYNRHAYVQEKRAALERLASTIMGILSPEPAKVVALRAATA